MEDTKVDFGGTCQIVAQGQWHDGRCKKLHCHYFSGGTSFGTTLRRDSAQLAVLQVETPSFGRSHWVSPRYATKNKTIQTQSVIFAWLPNSSVRRNAPDSHTCRFL